MNTKTTNLSRRPARRFALGISIAFAIAARLPAADVSSTKNLTDQLKQLSFEELLALKVDTVYAASKHEQKTTEAPASVTIITREDIQQLGYRTLAEVLNGVCGFFTSFDRGYYSLGVRGVNRPGDYGGRILLNINGHRVNEPLYDSLFLGNDFPLDVDLIERVEVIRGPGSALYGNNAFFAVINVVTRQGHDLAGAGVETSGSYGSFDTYSGRFTFGSHFTNGVEMLLSGTYQDSAGNPELMFPEYSSINGGMVKNKDAESARKFFASISYGDFTLEGLYGRRDQQLPTAAYFTVFDDPREKLRDERSYVELRYQHKFAADWTLMARAYVDQYEYHGTYPMENLEPANPEVTLDFDNNRSRVGGGEVQVSKTFLERHRVTLGVEAQDDLERQLLNYELAPAAIFTDSDTSRSSFGVYAQDEFSLCTNLTLNVGGRYDHYSTFGGMANPRTALIYHPWQPTTFKLLYGQAYRAPNTYESEAGDGILYQANHDLKPETIRSYELVWEQAFAKNYRLTSSLFYEQINDLITQVQGSDGLFTFENTDSVDVKGAEVQVEGRWKGGFRGRVGYTFSQATDNTSGSVLNNSPKHLVKLQLIAPLYQEKIFAGLELQATSARGTVQGNMAPGFVVANLTLFSRELVKNIEFSASIYNLLDKRYGDPAPPDFVQDTIPQDGRTFRVKLTYHF